MDLDITGTKDRKEAEGRLKHAVFQYNISQENVNQELAMLQDERQKLAQEIYLSGQVINAIKNTPSEFDDKLREIDFNMKNYEQLLKVAKEATADIVKGTAKKATASVLSGLTIATLGGPALTTLVMSVGTASTGAAISGLTGIAATNATLAAIGGGSVAAGGAGIAGGEAVLAAFGPLGWIVGGTLAVGSGLLYIGKTKKAAEKMNNNAVKVLAGAKVNNGLSKEVWEKLETARSSSDDLRVRSTVAKQTWPMDFREFTDDQVSEAGTMVNNTLSAQQILNDKIDSLDKVKEEQ